MFMTGWPLSRRCELPWRLARLFVALLPTFCYQCQVYVIVSALSGKMFIMILQGDRYKACIRLLNTDVAQNLKLAMNSVPGKFPPPSWQFLLTVQKSPDSILTSVTFSRVCRFSRQMVTLVMNISTSLIYKLWYLNMVTYTTRKPTDSK